MANIFPTIESFGVAYNGGTFGLYVGTRTEKKMNKFEVGVPRKLAQANPYIGRVETLAIYQNAATKVNYYTLVKSECKREGINFTDEDFAIAFPKEATYASEVASNLHNMILEHATSGQRYLRLYKGRKPTKVVYFTLLDGMICEDKQILADIKRFTPAKSESAKQEALGITNIVECRNVKVENVVFLKQGDKEYIHPQLQGVLNLDKVGDLF